jgi:uncharacterized protein
MTKTFLTLTPTIARRLAITRQHLAGKRVPNTTDGILNIVRDLGCLQIDPISAVARSPIIVLFSRLGPYDLAHLDTLLWQEHKLIEYWAHCASIVLTEDYALHQHIMRNYGRDSSAWSQHVRKWALENEPLRRAILRTLRRKGPMLSRDFIEADMRQRGGPAIGWTSGHHSARMLDYLYMTGKIMVAGRDGIQKVWDLADRILPAWTPREKLSEREIVRRATQRSLHALGVATPKQITQHFIRGRYPKLGQVLAELEAGNYIERVQVVEDGTPWKGDWYIHTADLPLLERLAAGDWEPRTTLLSPFDNLICDRARTKLFFDFDYSIEIYTPVIKRKFGYYVLPILHGDQLIGRMDPVMDRANKRFTINALYAEPNAPMDKRTARAIRDATEELATFLGANDIAYPRKMPKGWR